MDPQALREEAISWFKRRLAADAWLDQVRDQTRPLRRVSAPTPPIPPRHRRRPRTKVRAA